MKSESLRALLINDVDPAESKGAASIALDLASRVFGNDNFVYLCTTKKSKMKNLKEEVYFEYLNENFLDRARDKIRNRFPVLEGVMRVFTIRRLWRIFLTTKRLSPKIIWVHQIGWRIPVVSLLLFSFLRIPVFLTIHDYTFLRFRKIYPSDFITDEDGVEAQLLAFHANNSPLNLQLKSKPNFWHKSTRFIIEKTCKIIYISELQSSIYSSAGYPSGLVINNTVNACKCTDPKGGLAKERNELNILFAGRLIGKGLERLVESISQSKQVHIHIAGEEDLLSYVKGNLPSHRYTYHGLLEKQQLYRLIHSVDITAVPSTCFDVFPTITIESLAHETPVISTLTTGNVNFVRDLNQDFVLSIDGIIQFQDFKKEVKVSSVKKNLRKLKRVVTNDVSVITYRSLFESVIHKQ